MKTLFPYFFQRHKKNVVYILENHDDYNMAVEFCLCHAGFQFTTTVTSTRFLRFIYRKFQY